MKFTIRLKGGKGSGHHGHAGRPGKLGGSVAGHGGVSGGVGSTRTLFSSDKYRVTVKDKGDYDEATLEGFEDGMWKHYANANTSVYAMNKKKKYNDSELISDVIDNYANRTRNPREAREELKAAIQNTSATLSGGNVLQNGTSLMSKYFNKYEGSRKIDDGREYDSFSYTGSNKKNVQTLNVYRNPDKTFYAVVSGGYRGSLNTWGKSGDHKSASEAADAAIKKAESFLSSIGDDVGGAYQHMD